MPTQPVLAAIDFSESTDAIVAMAAEMARCLESELVLVHVAPPDPDFVGYEAGPDSVRRDVAHEFRDEHRRLERLAEAAAQQGLKVTPLLLQGPTVDTILDKAADLAARAIVVGSHGHGTMYHLIVGSVSEGILRDAKCPVVVIPRSAVAMGK